MFRFRHASLSATTLAAIALLTAWPASAQVDPNRFIDTFERVGGKFDGFRRSGAKGVCAMAKLRRQCRRPCTVHCVGVQRPAGAGGGALLGGRRQPQGA
jgi:hypothetical protein